METKFIKYKPEQINLAQLYRFSSGADLSNVFADNDVQDGTLVIGYYCEGKYLAMGYLCGMARNNSTGKFLYEIENAIEGDIITVIQDPRRVNVSKLPYFAATTPDFPRPIVGRIYKCNGELAVIDYGGETALVNVNSVLDLLPHFKETNENG